PKANGRRFGAGRSGSNTSARRLERVVADHFTADADTTQYAARGDGLGVYFHLVDSGVPPYRAALAGLCIATARWERRALTILLFFAYGDPGLEQRALRLIRQAAAEAS